MWVLLGQQFPEIVEVLIPSLNYPTQRCGFDLVTYEVTLEWLFLELWIWDSHCDKAWIVQYAALSWTRQVWAAVIWVSGLVSTIRTRLSIVTIWLSWVAVLLISAISLALWLCLWLRWFPTLCFAHPIIHVVYSFTSCVEHFSSCNSILSLFLISSHLT